MTHIIIMWKIKLTKLLFEKLYVIAIIQKKKKMTPKTADSKRAYSDIFKFPKCPNPNV